MVSLRAIIPVYWGLIFILPFLGWATPWPKVPDTISTASVNASSPSLAIDLNGRAIGVWIENDQVVSSQKLFQQDWSASEILSASGASSPMVKVDPNGLVTAIWLQNGALMTANQPFNGSWSTPVALVQANASQAQMDMDSRGNIVVVWQALGVIQSSTQLIGGSWSSSPDILSGVGASSPAVSIGNNGTVCVVWQQTDNTIYAISKLISGSWGSSMQISSSGVLCSSPQIAVNGVGDAIAGWFRFEVNNGNYSEVVVQSTYQPVSGVWRTPVDVSSAGTMDPTRLTLTMAGGENSDVAVMAWTNSYDLSLFNVEYAKFRSGQWEEVSALVTNNLMAYAVNVAKGSDDDVYLAYMYWSNFEAATVINSLLINLSLVESFAGTEWQLSISGMNAYPNISLNLLGTSTYGTCTWLNYDGSYNAVQTIVTRLPEIQPPTQLSAVQQSTNYGIFTQYNNIVTWTPSVSSQTAGYVLSRDGLQLAIFYSSLTPQFIDFNRLPSETVNYSLYAFDNYGYVSSTVTLPFTPP